MNARSLWISAGILALALVLRVVDLDVKPAHFDEGVNGWFVDQMTQQGYYHYDPTNFHGPLHFYGLFVAQTLLGRGAWVLRLPIALLSTVCVGLVLAFRRYLDERACQVAALAMAISPGMVFYGRYAIHETWLLFFLMLTAWGLPGLWRFGERRSLWAVAMGVTGMILTKETYVVHLIAFILAAPCLIAYERLVPSDAWPFGPWKISRGDCLAVAGVSLGLIVFFYSGGFFDWPGPQTFDDKGLPLPRGSICGLWETFATWTRTGLGTASGHEKDWWYWLQLLCQYEWPALVGLVAGFCLLLPRTPRVARYIAIYGLGAFIGYSIIKYKTPWCVISLMWPFHLVLGLAVVRTADWLDRWTVAAFATVIAAFSLGVTWKLTFRDFDDDRELYVYVQTFADVNLLLKPLRTLAKRDARNFQLRGHIVLPETYPWIWTLADFPRIDFPSATPEDIDKLPAPLDADFLLIDEPLVEQAEPLMRLDYYKMPMRIRGNSDSHAMLYLHTGSFEGVVPAGTPIFVRSRLGTPTEKPDSP